MAEEKKMDIEEEKSSSSSTAIRFEIKKWNAVAMWSWDICSDTCAICRNSLNEPSIEYQVSPVPLLSFFFLVPQLTYLPLWYHRPILQLTMRMVLV